MEKKSLPGGAMSFRLPSPEHLIVADLATLPTASEFSQAVRAYAWSAPPGLEVKGQHAHLIGKELFIGLSGEIEVVLSVGPSYETLLLKKGDALYVPAMVWHAVRPLQEGALMMVLSDRPYEGRSDYIEDHVLFLDMIGSQKA